MKVIKRDGREVKFNSAKIHDAIIAAAVASNIALAEGDLTKVSDEVVNQIEKEGKEAVEVEEIQDYVVATLRKYGHTQLAKKYQSYRVQRNKVRERSSRLMNTIYKIGIETDRDNANVGNNFSAKLLRIASESNKWHMLLKHLPRDMATHHEVGDYYIHDLDSYNLTTNCLHLPTRRLLEKGFNTGYGTINPPTTIETAGAILCIALQASQNDMFGGQSHPNFDNDIAITIPSTRRKVIADIKASGGNWENKEVVDKILRRRVCQAMQGVVYNLNTLHSRAGSQVPFSSINIGLPENENAALVCECFLQEYEKGLGCGEQPIFPNIIFRVKEGVNRNPKDPYFYLFRLACKVASKRMNPTFMNIDATFNKEYYDKGIMPATMGCRTYLLSDINGKPCVEGRGNIAPCTMNLPRLAIKANKNIEVFFKSLDELCEEVRLQLMHRYDTLKKLKVKDMPFVCGEGLIVGSEGLKRDDSIEPVLKHGTWGIGFIGLAETLKLLIGKHHGESKDAQELGYTIVKRIRENCDKFKQKYKLNFACYATPAEGLSGKFFPLDEKEFGKIPWVTTKGYYTNSFHVPVDYPISVAEKLTIEAPYHELCNGGHISYVEFDSYPTPDDIMRVVMYAYSRTNINYIGVNFHIRYCLDCKSK